jgi:lysophospholipase L1-like esterase
LDRNTDVVEAGGYYGTIDTTGTVVGSGRTIWEGISLYQHTRLRQNGTITKLQFYNHSVAGMTSIIVSVWRKLGVNSNVYRIATSEDMKAVLTPATVNTVTLVTPLTGCREGDYLSIKAVHPTGMASFAKRIDLTGGQLYSLVNPSESTNPTNWEGTTLGTDTVLPIKAYMQAPHIVVIGDSLAAGGSNHKSFADTTISLPYIVDRREASLAYILSQMIPGLVYQNMGRGGETSTQIVARFTNDCINLKPKYAYICMGANDQGALITPATTLANVDTVIAACVANSINIIWLLLFPNSNKTNTEMQEVDYLNTEISTRVVAAGGKVIDAQGVLGKYRSGGDEDNLWDWADGKDSGDGTHPSPSGYYDIAAASVIPITFF